MEFLLLRSHREEVDEDEEEDAGAAGDLIHVTKITDPDLGTISISAIPLKPLGEQPEWLRRSNNRVFHAVNGQVQFKQTRGYLSTSCKLPALKDRIVVIVDASRLKFAAHNEIWKGDREHVRNTIFGERYKDVVTEEIRRSEVLNKLQEKVAEEELKKATTAESNALFQKLVDADHNLAALLSNRDPTIRLPSSGGSNGGDTGKGEFAGKTSPTFVRLEEKSPVIEIPINRIRPIAARTDVENGYLRRTDLQGRVVLTNALRSNFGVREHLSDGRLTIYFEPKDDRVNIGQTFQFHIGLQDDAMPGPVETNEIGIKITEPQKPKPPTPREPKEPKAGPGGENTGKGERSAPTHGLPKCVLLTRDGGEIQGYACEKWPDDFTEQDGGLVVELGNEGSIYKINYHNAYHIKYREQQRGQVAKDVVTEKYILGMRILLLGFEHAYRALLKLANDKEALDEVVDQFRRMAARGAASTVLALAENLPKIVDKAAITEEAE